MSQNVLRNSKVCNFNLILAIITIKVIIEIIVIIKINNNNNNNYDNRCQITPISDFLGVIRLNS